MKNYELFFSKIVKMNSEEIKNWNELSDDLKMKKLIGMYLEIKKVSRKQLDIINKHKTAKNVNRELAHKYLYLTIEDFWNKVEYFVSLKNNKNRKYSGLILRSLFEQFLHLVYFSSLDKSGQNNVASKEYLRILQKMLKVDFEDQGKWQKEYEKYKITFSPDGLPEKLEEVTRAHVVSASLSDICELAPKVLKVIKDNLYSQYSLICEDVHNGLMAIEHMRDKKGYIRNFMLCNLCSRYMIELVDIYYLKQQTREDVIKAVKLSIIPEMQKQFESQIRKEK